MRFLTGVLFLLSCLMALPAGAVPLQILVVRAGQMEEPLRLPGAPADGVRLRDLFARAAAESRLDLEIVDLVPFQRALKTLESTEAVACVPTLVRLPERERFVRFSAPVIPAEQLAVIHRKGDPSFARYRSFDELLADRGQVLAWRSKMSYGRELQRRFDAFKPVTEDVVSPSIRLYDIVAGGRASYALGPASRWQDLVRQEAGNKSELTVLSLPDTPDIEAQHVGCSLATPPAFLEALDRMLTPKG
ncbi:MAG TPA: transporter substrate-binding domain-containing protein [Azospirillaceae bacterium]|nr:transporter substrate-binding domain-containing protein [Azospirillaceae bacterium]